MNSHKCCKFSISLDDSWRYDCTEKIWPYKIIKTETLLSRSDKNLKIHVHLQTSIYKIENTLDITIIFTVQMHSSMNRFTVTAVHFPMTNIDLVGLVLLRSHIIISRACLHTFMSSCAVWAWPMESMRCDTTLEHEIVCFEICNFKNMSCLSNKALHSKGKTYV